MTQLHGGRVARHFRLKLDRALLDRLAPTGHPLVHDVENAAGRLTSGDRVVDSSVRYRAGDDRITLSEGRLADHQQTRCQ